MIMTVNAACGCFLGNGREENEDNFYFNKKRLQVPNLGLKYPLKFCGNTDEPLLFAVFDGMGGASMGEKAAEIASQCFSEEYKKLEELAISGKDFLHQCCQRAGLVINQYRIAEQLGTMGTTVAAVYCNDGEVVACNVGDSKIFRIRDKTMLQISTDHTDEKIMKAIGINKKPVLLQYLGHDDHQMLLDPYISKGELCTSDVYVLCSDGVTDVLSTEELYELSCIQEASEAVERILARVEESNGADNATVIVIKIN
jgi:protein phosphatase